MIEEEPETRQKEAVLPGGSRRIKEHQQKIKYSQARIFQKDKRA
jgi:hypothetical protein